MKRIKKNNYAYIIVNTTLILLFLLGLVYLFFFDINIQCYYKTKFGLSCKTCGLTRDFKSIIFLNFSDIINQNSWLYFLLFTYIFISRFFSLFTLINHLIIKIECINIAVIVSVIIMLQV